MRYEAEYAYCWRECGAIPIGWGADMAREFYDILVYPDVKEADSTRRWRASPKSYTCEFRIWHPSTLTLKPVPAGIEILLYRTFSMDKLLDHVAEDQALSLTVEETLVLLRKTLRAATFETVRLDLDDDENDDFQRSSDYETRSLISRDFAFESDVDGRDVPGGDWTEPLPDGTRRSPPRSPGEIETRDAIASRARRQTTALSDLARERRFGGAFVDVDDDDDDD